MNVVVSLRLGYLLVSCKVSVCARSFIIVSLVLHTHV